MTPKILPGRAGAALLLVFQNSRLPVRRDEIVAKVSTFRDLKPPQGMLRKKRKNVAGFLPNPARERAAMPRRPACEAAEATAAIDLPAAHPIVHAEPRGPWTALILR
jgi:hypothetical protein